tara:strand:- start:3341 stop:3946 length:606 start_codon:yes stop_codon:yes gene_type:complete
MSNNWARRKIISYTPEFRIDVNNPTNGFLGAGVYEKYAHTDSGDISLCGMNQAGVYHLYNDQTIEIIGGGGKHNDRGGTDIVITGMKGSVVITAMENGDVKIKGANVIVEAKEDIKFKCGGNFTVDAGQKVDIKAKEAYCEAPHSYGPDCIATEDNAMSFLNQVYSGLKAEDIARAAATAAGGPGAGMAVSVAKKAISALG